MILQVTSSNTSVNSHSKHRLKLKLVRNDQNNPSPGFNGVQEHGSQTNGIQLILEARPLHQYHQNLYKELQLFQLEKLIKKTNTFSVKYLSPNKHEQPQQLLTFKTPNFHVTYLVICKQSALYKHLTIYTECIHTKHDVFTISVHAIFYPKVTFDQFMISHLFITALTLL